MEANSHLGSLWPCSQKGLLHVSFAKYVMISINTHHSVGLMEPPKLNRRYISAQSVVEYMHLVADGVFMYSRLYAESKSYYLVILLYLGRLILLHESYE